MIAGKFSQEAIITQGAAVTIYLPDHTTVSGPYPLVLVGANGSGKTRLGAQMALQFGYDRIPAHREGGIADQHGMQTFMQANADRVQYASYRGNPQGRANDIGFIYSELLAEQLDAQLAYAQRGKEQANQGILGKSRLEKAASLWEVLYPGRSLQLDYTPKVIWRASDMKAPIRTMSDGELSGLYLVLRLTIADPGVIIIDEPELHLHPVLARHFWDVAQELRPDCRFVYLTHDYAFALSRRGTIGIVQNEHRVKIVENLTQIPSDMFTELLGSAALSVVAPRIVFCEGEASRSVDIRFYSAWFNPKNTTVVPVKSCDAVRRVFRVFMDGAIVANANALALVERDYWSDDFLDKLKEEGLTVLEFHEIEGLFCMPDVFEAVAEYLSIPEPIKAYNSLLDEVRRNFQGLRLHKLVIERAKKDFEFRLVGLLNKGRATENFEETRAHFVQKTDISVVIPDAAKLFDKHAEIVRQALSEDALALLRTVPSKDFMGRMLSRLGLNSMDAYMRIIIDSLTQSANGGKENHRELQEKLVAALSPYLPPREPSPRSAAVTA